MGWWLLLSLYLSIAVRGQSSSDCTAFASDGLGGSTFQYYRFYDFRNVSRTRSHTSSSSSNVARSKIVTDDSWTSHWYIRDFPRKSPGAPSIPVQFIPERVFICKSLMRNEAG